MSATKSNDVQRHDRMVEASKRDVGKTLDNSFSYRVIAESPLDRRSAARRRLRFRSGKLIDTSGRFLSECSIGDRGGGGCRLALRSSTPLPRRVRLYDDQNATIDEAVIVWHSGHTAGLALLGPAIVPEQIRATLGASLYAVRN